MPLNDIATEQAKATENPQAATNQLLDYLATRPDATKNNLMFIGNQDVIISAIITQNIIPHNITKICADSYYIRKIAFRFCKMCYTTPTPTPTTPVARAQTHGKNPSARRATQLMGVLACVYSFSRQNLNTNSVP
jgi:hypothetical protein